MQDFPHFRQWCKENAANVCDPSRTYFEMLTNVIRAVNTQVKNSAHPESLKPLKMEIDQIERFVFDYDTSYGKRIFTKYIAPTLPNPIEEVQHA